MAALPEDDLRKILGEDYRAQQLAVQRTSGLGDAQMAAKSSIEGLEGKRFSGLAMLIMGSALIITGYFYTSGTPLMIQDAAAGVLVLAGGGLMAVTMKKIAALQKVVTARAT